MRVVLFFVVIFCGFFLFFVNLLLLFVYIRFNVPVSSNGLGTSLPVVSSGKTSTRPKKKGEIKC